MLLRYSVGGSRCLLQKLQHLALIKKGLRYSVGAWVVIISPLQHLALIKKGLQNAKSPALTGLFFWSVYLQRFGAIARIGGKFFMWLRPLAQKQRLLKVTSWIASKKQRGQIESDCLDTFYRRALERVYRLPALRGFFFILLLLHRSQSSSQTL